MAVVMPIGALAQDEQTVEAKWGTSKENLTDSGTLAMAFEAAWNSNEVAYVQLQCDVDAEDSYEIDAGTFTLDLNGHTLSCDSSSTLIINHADMQLTDSSVEKDGKILCTKVQAGVSNYAVRLWRGTLTIDCGSYEADAGPAVAVYSGKVMITDGNFKVKSVSNGVIMNEFGELTISGGNFYTENVNCAVRTGTESSTTTISGGTFYDLGRAAILYNGGKLDFSGHKNPMGISVLSYLEGVVGDEAVKLPEGYSFYNRKDEVIAGLMYNEECFIGKDGNAGFTLTLKANNDTEEMVENVNVTSPTGRYTLPECPFTAPEKKMFKAWLIGEVEYQPGEVVCVTADTEAKAIWIDCFSNIIIKMHDSYGDGWADNAIVVKKDGEEIRTLTLAKGSNSLDFFVYDAAAEYTFYWNVGRDTSECSFEIFAKGEPVFVAVAGDCVNYENGMLIFTLSVASGEGSTDIEEMKELRVESKEIYDLNGRRVEAIVNTGIYIVNGKKVLVK